MTAKGGNFAAPADQASAVTPDDNTNFAFGTSRALYVGGGGDLTVVMGGPDANTVLFPAVPSGALLPIIAKRVKATGTGATGIVALY